MRYINESIKIFEVWENVVDDEEAEASNAILFRSKL